MSELDNILSNFTRDGGVSDGETQSGMAQMPPTGNQDSGLSLTDEHREHDSDSRDGSDSLSQSTDTLNDDDDPYWPDGASDTTAVSSVADVSIHGIPNPPHRARSAHAVFFAGATNIRIDGTRYPNGLNNQDIENLINRPHVRGQSVFRVVNGDAIHIHDSGTTDFSRAQNLGPSTHRAQGRDYSGAGVANRRHGSRLNSGNAPSRRILVNAQGTSSSNDGTIPSVSSARNPRLGGENFSGARNLVISGGTFMNVGGRMIIEDADIRFL